MPDRRPKDAARVPYGARNGETRTGYVVFGSYWFPRRDKVRVEWD
jgi:hypothetical protein